MFKTGDIVIHNKLFCDLVKDNKYQTEKFIVIGTSDKDQQLSMLDYPDLNIMFLGNYCYLEIDVESTRKQKIEKLKGIIFSSLD